MIWRIVPPYDRTRKNIILHYSRIIILMGLAAVSQSFLSSKIIWYDDKLMIVLIWCVWNENISLIIYFTKLTVFQWFSRSKSSHKRGILSRLPWKCNTEGTRQIRQHKLYSNSQIGNCYGSIRYANWASYSGALRCWRR